MRPFLDVVNELKWALLRPLSSVKSPQGCVLLIETVQKRGAACSTYSTDSCPEPRCFSDYSSGDVGCGNGYYGWRMLGAGASFVLGLDPILRYLMQFEVFHRYAAKPTNEPVHVPSHHVVPMIDTELPERCPFFDIVVSAGVLYHRTSPIDHLRSLHGMLKPGGQVVLETLIIDGTEDEVLVPEDRYARMRNVWFLPSIKMLERWLRRTGYQNITVADVNDTSTQEQRSTPWMTFQSLADFLDPNDPAKTIEGYSAPKRALLIATK